MKFDLFGNQVKEKTVEVNIYADEAMDRKCPYTGNNWHYTCLIVERLDNPLLDEIISLRHCGFNPDDESYRQNEYFDKNNKIIHWVDLSSADEKNICKRWFDFILNPNKSEQKFFCYILGINESFLNPDEFDKNKKFNSIYNRFFRTAIEYSLKCFFNGKKVIIKKIYHEQGQQQHSRFKWHPIDKLSEEEQVLFHFECKNIQFLGKDHTVDARSNILQLCDCFLGAVVNIIHGLENHDSKRARSKIDILKNLLPLVGSMTDKRYGKNSEYVNGNRIMIRFFPKSKTQQDTLERKTNQFYTNRRLKFKEDIARVKQQEFNF